MPTLQELKPPFLRELQIARQLSNATVTSHDYVLESLIAFCKTRNVTEHTGLTRELLVEYLYLGRTERNWKRHTLFRHYANLNVFFKWLVICNHLPTNPLATIPRPRTEQTVPVYMNVEQAQKLLSVAREHWSSTTFERDRNYALVSTLLLTGMRRSEASQLTIEDLDLSEDGGGFRIKASKTCTERLAPFRADLRQAIVNYLKQREAFLKRRGRVSNALFISVSERHCKNLTPDGIARVIRRLTRLAGLPKNITTHKLRHSCASLLVQSGAGLNYVQQLLGHKRITTTMIYTHTSTKDLARELNKHPLTLDPINAPKTNLS